MVSMTDAPPERLYRPDVSLLEWRRLVEDASPFAGDDPAGTEERLPDEHGRR